MRRVFQSSDRRRLRENQCRLDRLAETLTLLHLVQERDLSVLVLFIRDVSHDVNILDMFNLLREIGEFVEMGGKQTKCPDLF